MFKLILTLTLRNKNAKEKLMIYSTSLSNSKDEESYEDLKDRIHAHRGKKREIDM